MRNRVFSAVLAGIVIFSGTAKTDDFTPLSLDYQAQTHAYTYAEIPHSGSEHSTDDDSSLNSRCVSYASASIFDSVAFATSYFDAITSGNIDSGEVSLSTQLRGDCSSNVSGSCNGNGYTSLQGTLSVGQFPGCPSGTPGLILEITAQVNGDVLTNHNWWFKIWTDDPNNPLVIIDQNNMSVDLPALSDDTFNIMLYHIGEENPNPGTEYVVSTTIDIDISAVPAPLLADIDGDSFVDFFDYAFIADDWQLIPDPCDPNNGDITRNNQVDIYDLAHLTKFWLTCFVAVATNPVPANYAAYVSFNSILQWSPGKNAISHDIYFGTDFNEVDNAEITDLDVYMGNQDSIYWDTNNYDPCGLDVNTTFYWRVDEVGPSCIAKGDVWRFTTAVNAYDTNLVSWWRFDEGSGSIAHDSVFGNDGTIYGDPQWVPGKVGDYALDFDPDGDYVEIPDNDLLTPANELTIAFWAYNRNRIWLGKFSFGDEAYWPSNVNSYYAFVGGDDNLAALVVHSSQTAADGNASPVESVPRNEWHHIAMTFNRGEIKVFIDGVLSGSGTATATSIRNDDLPFIIGGSRFYYGENSFIILTDLIDGTIDDLRIYNRELSQAEVYTLYQMGL